MLTPRSQSGYLLQSKTKQSAESESSVPKQSQSETSKTSLSDEKPVMKFDTSVIGGAASAGSSTTLKGTAKTKIEVSKKALLDSKE